MASIISLNKSTESNQPIYPYSLLTSAYRNCEVTNIVGIHSFQGRHELEVQRLAEARLGAAASDFLRQLSKLNLHEDIQARHDWFGLTLQPPILSTLMEIYEREGYLPPPGALGKELTESLWLDAQKENPTAEMSFAAFEADLRKFAFEWIVSDYGEALPVDFLRDRPGGADFLNLGLRVHYFLVRDEGFRFSHPLIQSHFAAAELARVGLSDFLEAPQFEDQGFMIAPRKKGKWDDVVIALCSVGEAEAIVRQVMNTDIYLAGLCIAKTEGVSESLRQQIITALLERVSPEFRNVRRGALEVLAEIGDDAVPGLLNLLNNKNDPYGRSGAAWALRGVKNPAAVPALIECLMDLRVSWAFGVAVCDYAAGTLEAIGTAEGLDALRRWPEQLIPLLKSSDVNQRFLASFKLSSNTVVKHKDMDAYAVVVPYLVELLADQEKSTAFSINKQVYEEAAHALYMIGTLEAENALKAWNPEYFEMASKKYWRD